MIRSLRPEHLEDRAVPAAVGALDPSFGVGGLAAFNVGGADGAQSAVALGDGRVVVAGYTPGAGGLDFLVERVQPDGTLDPTFGTGGRTTIDFGGGNDGARAVALDPAGNILVGGKSTPGGGNDRVAVARLTPNGVIDGTFGLAGKVILPLAGLDIEARSLLPEANGRVVVAGTVTAGGVGQFTIGRLTSAGAIDGTFGTAGNTTFTFGFAGDTLSAATRDAGGNIVLVGRTMVGAVDRFAVARLTPDGALDGTFGIGGKAWFNLAAGTDDLASAVAVDAAGRLVIAGTSGGPGGLLMGVARLNGNGAPDGTFGTGGVVRTGAGGVFSQALSVVIQPGGRIVLGGITGAPAAIDIAVVGLTPAGTLDPTFNPAGATPGATVIDFGGLVDVGYALLASANGRLVVVGTRESVPGGVELARLIGDVEKGTAVAAGGVANGTAALLDPTPAGALPGTPTATLAAFGGAAVNVRTAVADVDGDGIDDVILATGPGTPLRVAVVSGADNATLLVAPFDPFGGDFAGGGFVSAGDFDHDGRAEFVVSPDVSGGPRVTVFSRRPDGSTPVRANFFGIDDPGFRGGARTAVGDVNGDGTPDLIVAAGFGGGPRVAVFRGASVLSSLSRLVGDFFAFPGTDAVNLRNGAFVAAGDVDGDGYADLAFGGGPGGAPRVFILSGALVTADNVAGAQAAPVVNFFVAGNAADRGGVRVAVADLDGDTRADVLAGSGEGVAAGLRAYLGKSVTGTGEPATFQDVTLFGGGVLPGGVFVG